MRFSRPRSQPRHSISKESNYLARILRSSVAVAVAALAVLAPTGLAAGPGEIGPASGQTQNGRQLTPAGRLTTLGVFPTGGALTPDGRFYWAANSGHYRDSVSVVDVASGEVVQTLPLPGAYVGVAFASDGRTAYVTGAATGNKAMPDGATKGGSGDEIHVFSVDPATGRGTEAASTINVAPASPKGRARTDSLIPTTKVYPEGLDVSPDGATLVVALNQGDQVALVDTKTKAVRFADVGQYPFSAQVDRGSKRAFVTNELTGTVSVVDLASATTTASIPVGGPPAAASKGAPLGDFNAHPEGMALDPTRPRLYVAVANRDLVAVVDTTTLKTIRYVSVGRSDVLGTSPVALTVTPDGRTLLVADANEDAVAAIALTDRVMPGTAAGVERPGTAAGVERPGTAAGVERPGTAQGIARTVYAPRSTASILRYRAARVRARRQERARLLAARTPAARRTAARAYRARLAPLRRTLLVGARGTGCAGPNAADDARYRLAVLRAATRRDALTHRAAGSSRAGQRRRAAARRAFARTALQARRALPARGACAPATAGSPGSPGSPGTAGSPGSPGSPGTAGRSVPAFSLIGRIPTAAYPQDVRVTPNGKRLVWLAGKGLGAGPNPTQPSTSGGGVGTQTPDGPAASGPDYVLNKLNGRAGVLDLPSDDEIAGPLNDAANAQVVPADAQAPPAGTPVQGPTGGASDKIKHVFYIVKENRTYDQVLGKGVGGTGPQGDGQANLEAFGDNVAGSPKANEGVTPNLHALARRFGLLDHVYADSEVSIDGHIITSGAYATDYNQKSTPGNYSGRGRAFDYGLYNVALAPEFSAFDQAARQAASFRYYGEASAGTFAGNAANMNENGFRPTAQVVTAAQDASYPSQATYGCAASAQCFYDSGVPTAKPITPPTGFNPQTSRYQVFERNFMQELAQGAVPAFNYLTVPNDHTNGTTAGGSTPTALVADNDLAVGQIVDLISHSAIWKDSAIFVTQDDTQAGADHVDAHRMPALVVSPWARGGLVTTRYDQYSFLRTAMAIVGLKPLSLNDALATPLYDAFVNAPAPTVEQLKPYDAVRPQQAIDARNMVPATPVARSAALLSAAMPFDHQDLVPQTISDRIVWLSVFGDRRPVPPPGPNASPDERRRGAVAMRAFHARRSVLRALAAGPADAG